MTVDPNYAQWLKEGALYQVQVDGALSARWGASATTTEILSPLALLSGAQVEAARQLGFLSGPLFVDALVVPGLRRDLLGRPHLDGTDVVFVIGFDEGGDGDAERTTLSVLRRKG